MFSGMCCLVISIIKKAQEDTCNAVCLLYSLGIFTCACRSSFLSICFVSGFLVVLLEIWFLIRCCTQAAGSWWKDALFHTTDNFIVELTTVGCCRGLTSKWIQKVTLSMSTGGYSMQQLDVTMSQRSLYLYASRSICKGESFEIWHFLYAFLNIYYLSLRGTKWWAWMNRWSTCSSMPFPLA